MPWYSRAAPRPLSSIITSSLEQTVRQSHTYQCCHFSSVSFNISPVLNCFFSLAQITVDAELICGHRAYLTESIATGVWLAHTRGITCKEIYAFQSLSAYLNTDSVALKPNASYRRHFGKDLPQKLQFHTRRVDVFNFHVHGSMFYCLS